MDHDLTFKVVAERGRRTACPLLEYSIWASISRLDHLALFEGKGCKARKTGMEPKYSFTSLDPGNFKPTGSFWRFLVLRGSICVQRVWYTTPAGFRTV